MIPNCISITAAFLVKDKKVLVAQRKQDDSNPLKWEFPGGKVNDDEKYDDALIREFYEEFGVKIEVVKEIGGAEAKFNAEILIIVFFLVEGDASKLSLKVHQDIKFAGLEELKKLDLCEADKNFVNNYYKELKLYIG